MQQSISQHLITAAIERANQINIAVNIAIFDSGANLMAFQRMDGAQLGSIDVALKKAKTAVLFKGSTERFGQVVRDNQLNSIEQTNDGLILFAGGEPINHASFLGGIGISGGSAEQDKEIALYAISKLSSLD